MIGFGGGCHWCTEAVFQSLRGVVSVRQGFISSDPPHTAPSEAVELRYDPDLIQLDDLVVVHLATHASTSDHSFRGKYRSAIYVTGAQQAANAQAALTLASQETGARFVTQVLAHRGFALSDSRFHDYYRSDPTRPFCQTYIAPKLAKLKSRFATLVREEP